MLLEAGFEAGGIRIGGKIPQFARIRLVIVEFLAEFSVVPLRVTVAFRPQGVAPHLPAPVNLADGGLVPSTAGIGQKRREAGSVQIAGRIVRSTVVSAICTVQSR